MTVAEELKTVSDELKIPLRPSSVIQQNGSSGINKRAGYLDSWLQDKSFSELERVTIDSLSGDHRHNLPLFIL
jgi:hypothetical protein